MNHTKTSKRRLKLGRILAAAVCILFLLFLAVVVLCYFGGAFHRAKNENSSSPDALQVLQSNQTTANTTTEATTTTTTTTTLYPPVAQTDTKTVALTDASVVLARNAALIDPASHTLIAQRKADEQIYPASLTKIMSMLTVIRLLGEESKLYHAYIMDGDLIGPLRAQSAVCAGFQGGEPCRIIDMLYGMMLPSGADAAVGMAIYTAGSVEAFVSEMNAYAKEMGLTQTHFVNCTGLHDDRHVSTVNEIACILSYALQNPLCRQIMATDQYTTAATVQHPNGLTVHSTLFSRMTGTELDDITVCGGKTGFTDQAGQCLATWAKTKEGKEYICVVAGCNGAQPMEAVYDTLTIYDQYRSGDGIGAERFMADSDGIADREAA